ncbi:MAG: SprT family zinc-dependent metalloprotease [Proteobacteria bacterium]|nr:SprT family zinc-dependent metalloprotease [Pseudomonadota bacterium]
MARELIKETALELAGTWVAVRLFRNNRARRVILRLDEGADGGTGVIVTLPNRASQKEGLALVLDKADWILNQLDERLPRVPFADGETVPFFGVDYRIRSIAGGRGVVRCEGAEILVAGRPEHLVRRVKDWFKLQAREQIAPRVRDKAQALDRRPGRITIRDTKSRWGSCSHDGNLSFCWRLVMAPEAVLDYVVAHEVAHLAELNHGPKFWHWVGELTADVAGAKKWLRLNGEALHRYG